MVKSKVNRFDSKVTENKSKIEKIGLNPNQLYCKVFNLLTTMFNNIFKIKQIHTNLTGQLYQYIPNKLYELYSLRQWNQDPAFWFENFQKYLKKIIKAKSMYIRAKILKSRNKIKATWDAITIRS